MNRLWVVLAFALAACGGAEGGKQKAGEPPPSARAKAFAMDPTAAAAFVIAQVTAEESRGCTFVHELTILGDAPAGGPHAGARVYAVQCSAPGEAGAARWMVTLPADGPAPVVAPCVQNGADACAANYPNTNEPAPDIPPEQSED